MDAPPDPTRYLWILVPSELHGSIVTREFDTLQPITVLLKNCNLILSQLDSYIYRVLTSSIDFWSVKGTSFLGIWWKFFKLYFERYLWQDFSSTNGVADRVQPKTPPFSTCHIVSVNYKVASQLPQPIFLSFSYLNSARHFSVIELCREPLLLLLLFYGFREDWLIVFLLFIFFLFSIMQISIFISPERSRFCA